MRDSPDNACRFLENLQRFDLSALLRPCRVHFDQFEVDDGSWGKDLIEQATVESPKSISEALEALPDYDRKRIAEAIASEHPGRKAPYDIVVKNDGSVASGVAVLLSELIIHRAMMINVSTGGRRIQDVNDYYRAREVRIRDSMPDGVDYKNSFEDLWGWYRHWGAHQLGYESADSSLDKCLARSSTRYQLDHPRSIKSVSLQDGIALTVH